MTANPPNGMPSLPQNRESCPVPLIIAHRGYSARYRENAPSSWQAAVAAGADLVEVDVRMTADGVLVCAPWLSQTCGWPGIPA